MRLVDFLITMLTLTDDISMKAMILQTYVEKYGPIPNDKAEEVKKALEVEHE